MVNRANLHFSTMRHFLFLQGPFAAFTVCAVLLCCSIPYSEQSIFSSILRNNLNRYLKNPLFTKSIAPGWPGEQHEHGSSALISPQNGAINEFIKSQNKFANEHLMEPYNSNYNFNLMALNSEFPGIIAGQGGPPPPLPHPQAMKQARPNTKMLNSPVGSSTNSMVSLSGPPESINRPPLNGTKTFFEDKSSSRPNSKSLTVSSSVNAYSDTNKLKQFSNAKNKNAPSKKAESTSNGNQYGESRSVSGRQRNAPELNVNRFRTPNTDPLSENFESHLTHTGLNNKYNQEKALNLKLEYGFKPLPNSQKSPFSSSMGDMDEFPVGNSIQLTDLFDFTKLNGDEEKSLSSHKEDNDRNEIGNNNIYNNLETSSNDESSTSRSMKSLYTESTSPSPSGNHLEEFAPDYKKYISYPMETESSDIHKLAFTGMESFKPEHSYVDSSLNSDHRLVDSLANYPNLKHFKSTGIDCARNSGYCLYDSSYPKDHVNSIIGNCSHSLDDMYIDMPENLADFSGFKSFIQVGRPSSRPSNSSLCDSERNFIRPSVAQDVEGNFYLILQSSLYFQQVPVEICSQAGQSCNVVGRCNAQVKCTQKYRTHMLISIDTSANEQTHSHGLYHGHSEKATPKSTSPCPRMRMYRLPSSCVCELTSRP